MTSYPKPTEDADRKIVPDPQYCLKEANIALVASDGWAFCVHQSVLQRISFVFRDMFEDYSPPKPPKQLAKFNDLDVVKISESGNIMRLFLAIVYDQKSVASVESYSALAELLVLCNKYMIPSIMKRIMAVLRPTFPDNLAAYRKQIRGPSLQTDDIIHIAEAALKANVKILLIVGLYFLVINRDTTAGHLTQLSHQLLVHYSHGLSKLSGLASRSQFSANLILLSEDILNGCNRQESPSNSTLALLWRYNENLSSVDLCSSCRLTLQRKVQGPIEDLWMSLPEIFMIDKSWEEAKKEEDEWFEIAEGRTPC